MRTGFCLQRQLIVLQPVCLQIVSLWEFLHLLWRPACFILFQQQHTTNTPPCCLRVVPVSRLALPSKLPPHWNRRAERRPACVASVWRPDQQRRSGFPFQTPQTKMSEPLRPSGYFTPVLMWAAAPLSSRQLDSNLTKYDSEKENMIMMLHLFFLKIQFMEKNWMQWESFVSASQLPAEMRPREAALTSSC